MRNVLALIGCSLMLTSCGNSPQFEFVPVMGANNQIVAKLETRIFKPDGLGPFPLVVLSHGSSGGHPDYYAEWENEASYLVKQGYAVIAPMRRGRGKSTGQSLESETRNCDVSSWQPGISTAIQDLDASIQYAQSLPYVKPRDITLWGVSRGGFLSVAYAANGAYKADVRKVINFVGGWVAQAEDQCPQDFNLLSFQKYGGGTKVPMLWLYGENDLFYGANASGQYVKAFTTAGGVAAFHLIQGIPENGHWLPSHPEKWKVLVGTFLKD